jgi:chemotaxis protein MotB
VLAILAAGCNAVPYNQYRMSQLQALQLYQQNSQLASQLFETQQIAAQLQAEKQQLELATGQLNGNLQIANQRIDNLNSERQQLHEKYRGMLVGYPPMGPALPGSALDQFRALAGKYPEFEFDPVTGVARFTGDLLFASGSDALRPESHRLLQEFAHIINDPLARPYKILIVGHTDDVPIVKDATRQRHPTNWDLSAHRATAVVKQLAAFGVDEPRMGVAGYSLYQPAQPNRDEVTRQQNRRVEIYVLAPDASVASAGGVRN